MKRFRVEHKHCGCSRVICGFDIYDAYRRCNCDSKVWKLVETLD